MNPYLTDPDVTLYLGDCLDVLREMPDESVDCCITSPPYWGLRDYGTGTWEGGDAECAHRVGGQVQDNKAPGAITSGQRPGVDASACLDCGATRADNQLGLEPTPELYVEGMTEVFREVRRVLAKHGTCWLNLGDSYAAGGGFAPDAPSNQARLRGESVGALHGASGETYMQRATGAKKAPPGLKQKDLVGIPWRVAFALQADGWYLRSDIIWSKPNPMPESVTDRPTKAHEYVFLLSKQPRYFFDAEAVRERLADTNAQRTTDHYDTLGRGPRDGGNGGLDSLAARMRNGEHSGRNIRSVWEIATQPFPEAHFATFPEELVRRCLLAGCPEQVCGECGAPRTRLVESESVSRPDLPRDHPEWRPSRYDNGKAGDPQSPGPGQRFSFTTTLGFTDCGHDAYRPGRVLDPFMGSGTVALVARKHGRRAVGIELSSDYCEMAAKRLGQQSLFAVSA